MTVEQGAVNRGVALHSHAQIPRPASLAACQSPRPRGGVGLGGVIHTARSVRRTPDRVDAPRIYAREPFWLGGIRQESLPKRRKL